MSLLYAKTFPITLRSGGLAIQGEKQEGTAANLSGFDALDGEKSITLPSIVSGSSPSTK